MCPYLKFISPHKGLFLNYYVSGRPFGCIYIYPAVFIYLRLYLYIFGCTYISPAVFISQAVLIYLRLYLYITGCIYISPAVLIYLRLNLHSPAVFIISPAVFIYLRFYTILTQTAPQNFDTNGAPYIISGCVYISPAVLIYLRLYLYIAGCTSIDKLQFISSLNDNTLLLYFCHLHSISDDWCLQAKALNISPHDYARCESKRKRDSL